jgi:hypothetical protein
VWKPTNELGKLGPVNASGLGGCKIELKAFTDARENREHIAENRESSDKGQIYPVTNRALPHQRSAQAALQRRVRGGAAQVA